MELPFNAINCVPRFFIVMLLTFLLIFPNETEAASTNNLTSIVALIDNDSRIGKEERIAMRIAVENFNNISMTHNLSIKFENSCGDPFLVASTVEKIIKEKEVNVIVGMHRWEEASLVADIGNRSQVPIISFASPIVKPSTVPPRWPYLISMATDSYAETKCIADLISSYAWRKVIVIYEDEMYGGDSGNLITLLSEALMDIGSEIEYRLGLPSLSSLSDPKGYIQGELMKLSSMQSRVFIILRSSLPMAIHLFREAKNSGFTGRESAWILSDSVADLLDTVNNSITSSIEGALGIKTFYSEESNPYREFYARFRRDFRTQYPDEDNYDPGIHALRAYDTLRTISKAIGTTTNILWKNIQASSFNGLSGKIEFQDGELSYNPIFRIVNVVGKRYKELDFWTPHVGFSGFLPKAKRKDQNENGDRRIGLAGTVNWPGDLGRVPKGWVFPVNGKVLRILIPGNVAFENFVNIGHDEKGEEKYDGFCIELFEEVRSRLDYAVPYEFEVVSIPYDSLVHLVANKTYDAVIGDMTILYSRSKDVEFTQPYTESGLSMIVPAKPEGSGWMFIRPFNWQMWLCTSLVLFYTMLAVWFLEHRSNPEFSGSWKNQISNTLWFTFSTLFFAQREAIRSNLTRVVVIMWLFVVFVLTSSYTASLSSMLTVQQIQTAPTIDWLRVNKLKVGCDADSFVSRYLENVLGFSRDNIIQINNEEEYKGKFEKNEIAAAFLELPYEKVFLNKYCQGYTSSTATYRFGGLGFVFQKGSPIARDFSQVILKLSETGELRSLENKWLTPSGKCSNNVTSFESESLKIESFWGLYVITVTITTICLILCIIRLRRLRRNILPVRPETRDDRVITHHKILWKKVKDAVRLAKFSGDIEDNVLGRAPSFSFTSVGRRSSSRRESVSTSGTTTPDNTSTKGEVEIT